MHSLVWWRHICFVSSDLASSFRVLLLRGFPQRSRFPRRTEISLPAFLQSLRQSDFQPAPVGLLSPHGCSIFGARLIYFSRFIRELGRSWSLGRSGLRFSS